MHLGVDLQTMIEIVKFIRKVPENAPFKEFVGERNACSRIWLRID
jgi:hypothetical protein